MDNNINKIIIYYDKLDNNCLIRIVDNLHNEVCKYGSLPALTRIDELLVETFKVDSFNINNNELIINDSFKLLFEGETLFSKIEAVLYNNIKLNEDLETFISELFNIKEHYEE